MFSPNISGSSSYIQRPALSTPILFLVFNRPNVTSRVFEEIRKAKPLRLYLAADGPRASRPGEAERCQEVRQIATSIDWPCEIKTLFRDQNLGCKSAVSSAIDWFFKNEERGIILEDDCLPHPDFFSFCDQLLERYAQDERISVITGNNYQYGIKRGDASYYFSKYNHCWGWASWRRAWKYYQGDLPFWPEWSMSLDWIKLTPDPVERRYWGKIFKLVIDKKIDSWAYPWTCSVWHSGGLTVTPKVNLVSNIGFGDNATHTTSNNCKYSELDTQAIGLLTHPTRVEQDKNADQWVFDNHFGGRNLRFPRSWIVFPGRVLRFAYRKFQKYIFIK
jgi:hypothetical protein